MLRIQQLHKAVALSLVESEKIDAKGASLIVPERMRSNSQSSNLVRPISATTSISQIYLENEGEEDYILAPPALANRTSLQHLQYCCTEDRDKSSDESVRPQSASGSPPKASAVHPKDEDREGRDATDC